MGCPRDLASRTSWGVPNAWGQCSQFTSAATPISCSGFTSHRKISCCLINIHNCMHNCCLILGSRSISSAFNFVSAIMASAPEFSRDH